MENAAATTLIDADPFAAEPLIGSVQRETVTSWFDLGDLRVLASFNYSGEMVKAFAFDAEGNAIDEPWGLWIGGSR